jgi:hypothetical protein
LQDLRTRKRILAIAAFATALRPRVRRSGNSTKERPRRSTRTGRQ